MPVALPDPADRWLYAWSAGYGAVGAASVLVPLYAIELGAGPFLVGVLAATAAFAGIPGALLWGRLATRTGRPGSFVLVSLGATSAVLVGLAFVRTLPALLVGNAVLWFAVSAAAPVLTLLVVDSAPESAWDARIGTFNAVQGYGWLVGLLVGSAWTAVAGAVLDPATAQRSLLLASGVVSVAALLLAARWLPRHPSVTPEQFDRSTRSLRRLLSGSGLRAMANPIGSSRAYWGLRRLHPRALARRGSTAFGAYLLAVACCFTGFAVFFGPLPAYLRAAGFGTGQVFVLFAVNSAASAAFYTRAGTLSSRHTPQRVQVGALAARAVAFPLVALAGLVPLGFAVLGVLLAVVGVTWALVAVTATAIVARLVPASVRGSALGAYVAIGGLGSGVGNLLGGWLAGAVGYLPTFVLAGCLVLLGTVAALAGFRRRAGPEGRGTARGNGGRGSPGRASEGG